MEINIRKGIEMSTNHNERLVITGHEKEGGLKDPYEMAGTGGKAFKGRAIWNRKSCLVFGILCAVGIFLIGMAGGALWSYLRELGYLREIDESCPLCRLKAEGRLRAKNESGLGILQLHTGQMILIDQSGKKGDENAASVILMYAGGYGSTVEVGTGRKVSEIDVFLSSNSVWKREVSQDILCDACMQELKDIDPAEGGAVVYDILLVDLGSGQVLQMRQGTHSYDTQDYFFHFDDYGDRIGIVVAYAPDR